MTPMPYMYILECADSTYYTGSTWQLERRLAEHNSGNGAIYTRKRLPVKLVYFEECGRIADAYHREKHIQKWSHKKKNALIESDWERLHQLAKCQNSSQFK